MRRITYIHALPEWPRFHWDSDAIAAPLAAIRHRQGRLLGHMEALGFPVQTEASLRILTLDALKTSEIEGEMLDRDDVRSSLARRLGLETATIRPIDRHADAIAAIVLDATRNFAQPLTAARLFDWHTTLFPGGGGIRFPLTIGDWRNDAHGAMQIVSGAPGRERIHFEAPSALRVPAEMTRFLAWFEDATVAIDPVLRAGLAHIWFVTVHPFDDGNGRIGRAIADLALARSEGTHQRFYSLSARLMIERAAYYATLEATQRGTLDVTAALLWFLGVLDRALSDAQAASAATQRRGRFWDDLAGQPINARQRDMLNRLLDGFEGKLTSSKWAKIAKCSQDTALRDIDALLRTGVLLKDAPGGRSTSYALSAGTGQNG